MRCILGLFFVAVAQHVAAQTDDQVRDDSAGSEPKKILLDLFQATGGLDWDDNTNWIQQGVSECDWKGIDCYPDDFSDGRKQGSIRRIDLSSNKLVGTLPTDVFEIPYLEILEVQGNGNLHVDFSRLSEAQFLIHLDISDTAVSNINNIGDARNLEILHITNLGLTGPIPNGIFDLTQLLGLFANYNAFTGTLPTRVGELTNLDELYLFHNELTGQIPTEIGRLSFLQILTLSQNGFGGTLPTQLDSMTNLQVLAIAQDDDVQKGPGITGSVPALNNHRELTQVYLENQKLSGSLQEDFLLNCPEGETVEVDLSNNQITGGVPGSLLDKRYLNLFLANNRIETVSQVLYDRFQNTCPNTGNWMDGDVENLGCDAFLCPPGTWAPQGRTTKDTSCSACADDSQLWGRSTCDSSTSPVAQEREILVNLYNVMGGRNWKSDDNWLDFDLDVCRWFGIGCTGSGAVSSINLRNNGLTGKPPADIFKLSELVTLNLAGNSIQFDFTGSSDATSLEVLDLTNTDLPRSALVHLQELSLLPNLRVLSLSSNDMAGQVPDDLYTLTTLEDLSIDHTGFTGLLSTRIGDMTRLQRLQCAGNKLAGQIPTQIGNLRQLQSFTAGENEFGGTLPTEMNLLSNLQTLQLQQSTTDGGIGGPLPSFNNMVQLTSLYLDSNQLTGSLPTAFLANSRHLGDRIDVGLSDNRLSGAVPGAWSRFDKLFVDLTDNRITSIDDILCQATGWMGGDVAAHQCGGILCPEGYFNTIGRESDPISDCEQCPQGTGNFLGATSCFGSGGSEEGSELAILADLFVQSQGINWKRKDGWEETTDYCTFYGIECDGSGKVVKIDLGDNGLTGSLATSVYQLPRLRGLIIPNNDISISFQGITQASTLINVHLGNTNLDSVDGISDAPNIFTLRLNDNELQGPIPPEIFEMTTLTSLDLSFNQLTGRISNLIGALSTLERLEMYHNHFTGRIPAVLGDMSALRVLNLAENNFDGTIPEELSDLSNLWYLSLQREGGISGVDDVGINQGDSSALGPGLTGTLPAFDKAANLYEVYLGVNSLSGSIPYNFLAGVTDKSFAVSVDLTSNRLTGTLPASLTEFSSMNLFVADNRITDIADGLCLMAEWLDGDVGTYTCDGILCPAGTYNALGRRGSSAPTCDDCPTGTNYMGSFECLTDDDHQENTERGILEMLFKAMDGESWIDRTNWLDPDESICTWYGIECVSGTEESVEIIDLSNNRLKNNFPTQIYDLPNLKQLSLQGNPINFSFDGIGNAAKLDYLDLEETTTTSLSGIESASGLKLFRADMNALGTFPTEIFGLSGIEVLSLSDNPFADGNVPQGIQSFSELVYFACGNCKFTGQVPTWLSSLANLEYLKLSQNKLTGDLPTELNAILTLKHLDLSDQRSYGTGGITGQLLDFAALPLLTELFLQKNHLTGDIPTTFLQGINNDELVTVDLRDNALVSIPAELGFITDLNLYVATNWITEVPQELCSKPWNDGNILLHSCDGLLCDIGSFNSFGRALGNLGCIPCDAANSFMGTTYCDAFFEHFSLISLYSNFGGPNWKSDINWLRNDDHCTWEHITCHEDGDYAGLIKEINLEDNNLVGSSQWEFIWNLEGLEYVNLGKNEISIPFNQIANAQNLHTIILTETSVASLEGIGEAGALTSLHVTNAKLSGAFPNELFRLTLLEELYLSYNDITGTLSTSIGQLKQLRDLYMFSNGLRGTLPTELGFLARLEHLSMGENKFSGPIPPQITSLPLLEVLSLERERPPPQDGMFAVGGGGLEGGLPAFDNLPRINQLLLGHNSLTGPIPEHFLDGVNDKRLPITVDLKGNSLTGPIPASLAEFDDMLILLTENQISGIPDQICNKVGWQDGAVAGGCDAILCFPGTFNEYGYRVDDSTPCRECTYPGSAMDYGSTECGPSGDDLLTDREILFELYDAAGGSAWTTSTNWNDNDVDFCRWYGVTCEPVGDHGELTVTEISLPDNNLDGVIPSIILHLPELRKLDVRNNPVSMTFNAIFRAVELQELYMDNTSVSSLDGIGQSTSLQVLHARGNAFGWQEIPEDLYDLVSLVDLDLSESMLAGTVSTKIGNLSNLKRLAAVGNALSGQLPAEIGMLSVLEELELSDNDWFGTLPSSVADLVSLRALFLGNLNGNTAGFTGPLHKFSTMPKIREIHLSDNQFTGTIPGDFLSGIDDTDSVINVHLDGNHIIGTVPAQLSAFQKLNIDLTDNLIVDIADGLCAKSEWNDGAVGSYDCNGLLCPAGYYSPNGRQTSDDDACETCPGNENVPYLGVSFCVSIQKKREREILGKIYEQTGGPDWRNRDGWLDDAFDICDWYGISCREGSTIESILLGSNGLTGTLPTEVFDLPNLKFLWLYSNPIDVKFEGIEKATSLRSLLLDSTRLGSLEGIGKARSLIDVDVRFNQLDGTIPKEIEQLVNLQSFTCSQNAFTGPVPDLGELRQLNTLRMGNNELTGTMPSFADHPELKALDLSDNKLVGPVPSNLLDEANVMNSIFLDLSDNALTGTIPRELSRFTDLTIYLRDNKIDGIDPALCEQDDWNDGDVGRFDCDGILCPIGTFGPSGRASRSGSTCNPCAQNKFFGSTTCSRSSAGGKLGLSSITLISSLMFMIGWQLL